MAEVLSWETSSACVERGRALGIDPPSQEGSGLKSQNPPWAQSIDLYKRLKRKGHEVSREPSGKLAHLN